MEFQYQHLSYFLYQIKSQILVLHSGTLPHLYDQLLFQMTGIKCVMFEPLTLKSYALPYLAFVGIF